MYSKGYKDKILHRIDQLPSGSVVVISDFADIAEPETIRQTLKKEVDSGNLTRVLRGVLYKPQDKNCELNPHDVAKAIARARRWSISPCGKSALRALGFTTNTPSAWVYVSDGPYASFEVGNAEIQFKRSMNRNITALSPVTVLVIEALKEMGKNRVGPKEISQISSRLDTASKEILLSESTRATIWIRKAICKICEKQTLDRANSA